MALPGNTRRSSPGSLAKQFVPLFLALMAFPFVLNDNLGLRILLAVVMFLVIYTQRAGGLLPVLTIIYLALMGGIRRNLIPLLGEQSKDPLLIVVPLVAILLALGVLVSRRVPTRSRHDRLLLIVLLYMIAEIFNPNQGPVLVGIGGSLFYIIPILWYYIGRERGDEKTMGWVCNTMLVMGSLGALYGIKQGIYGLTTAEQQWLTSSAYTSLYLSGTELRPFSFFTSMAEYAQFLMLTIAVAWALTIYGRRVAFCVIPLLCWALFYTGGRTPIVVTLAGCVMLWAVQGRTIRSWLPRGALAIVLATGGLAYGLIHAQDSGNAIVTHQTEGLLNPGDSRKSTVGAHASVIGVGLKLGVMKPLGMGLGYTTLAAVKLGGNGGFSAEMDVANLCISLGIVGGMLYLVLILILLGRAFRLWHRSRSLTSLVILGVLFTALGNWLNGGSYSVAMVVWLCIGAMENLYQKHPEWEHAT
jgi:hypothetical protein